MVKNKSMESFINYNYKELTKGECIERILCVWLFGVAVCLLGKNNTIFFALIIPVCLAITLLISVLAAKYIKLKGSRFLSDGISWLFYSIMLNLASYRFYMIFQHERNTALIVVSLLSLPVSIMCYLLIVYRNIKLDKYGTKSGLSAIGGLALLGGVFGILVAKIMINSIDQNDQVILVSLILLFLSILVSSGSMNFLKYFLWRKLRKSENTTNT